MTTDEQDAVVGRAFRELKAARKDLACLRSKADDVARRLRTLASVLAGDLHGTVSSGGDRFVVTDGSDGSDGIEVEVPDRAAVIALARQLVDAQTKVANLEERVRSFD